MRLVAALLLLCLLPGVAAADNGARHGLSTFGDLKYPEGFKHFDYVNPDAPKGGEVRGWWLETYDNLNPFILRGTSAYGLEIVFESLMEPSRDEPDSLYGLIAESVEIGPERAWAAFNLNPKARWHDGTPITSADVVFSFNVLVKEGHPQYRVLYRDVEGVKAEGDRRVLFSFKPTESRRDLPLFMATMPILSKAWFAGRDFARSTLDPPLASGPYKIDRVDPGRSISYRRVPDYWGKDLPVNVGRWNFDVIRFEYFRDRDIAFEALFAGEFDWHIENTARNWATGYDRPAVHDGFIKREVLRDDTPSGVQAFFINTRIDKFKDRRVRQALNYAFDFEWMNKNLFYGLYKRTRSMFENSDLAAAGLPSEAELKLLEPFRSQLPPEVFTEEFHPPKTDGDGTNRENMRVALRLLNEAGWVIKDGRRVNAKTGEPLTIEFLQYEPSFNRVINPFIRNLERLGIRATIRMVDVSTFENRMRSFDYELMSRRFAQPLTPGVEQRNYWSSGSVDVIGSFNFSGVKDPIVDSLVESIVAANSREQLRAATRALDRVLMWNWYVVPHWYSGNYRLVYWDKFGRPKLQPKHDLGLIDTWWHDPAKDAALPPRRRSQ